MKPKIQPTNREVRMADDEFIVSKTNTKGVITYVNRTFMRISGYSEPELMNIQHNIIRHPDMPRGAFRLLWNTLRENREFFGYVKNMCKDGGYYWVFANVTPDIDERGQLRGFYSVRRQPTQKAIETIVPIYRKMCEIEQQAGPKEGPNRSIAYLESVLTDANISYQDFVLSLDH